ncbi:hypothetical protein P280DRAFT_541624 [Massarina eburnea CBS 473.64]|uniref:Rhodopsin domain-containing protein n=1 Tax=Massarina eburnea CBS 473.64 TaxID=1395130 RepID=A0A6A6S2F7_9PLEO|nr:hypothetical protein P280DRAFT_541624 [Massarina eburnea CBS 473.64]
MDVSSIPMEELKLIPAEEPPPGITANFEDPVSLTPAVVGTTSAFLTFALFCFIIRIYTNALITRKWHWDDLSCTVGFILGIIYYAFVVLGCLKGTGGKHLYDLHLDIVLNRASNLQSYLATLAAAPAMGLIKCSLFIQYYRVFRPVRYVRVSVYIGATITATFYVAVTITAVVLTSPRRGENLLDMVTSSHFGDFANFSVPIGVIGMLVDWCLFCLPIPAVHSLQMTFAKKLGIMLVFTTGVLGAIASTIALYYRVQMQRDRSDVEWKLGYIFIWTQIEIFAGVAATSMPSVKLFFKKDSNWPSAWGSSFKYSVARMFGCSACTTSRAERLDDSPDYNGFHHLKDLPKHRPGLYDFSITSQGTIRKASNSYIMFPRDACIAGK